MDPARRFPEESEVVRLYVLAMRASSRTEKVAVEKRIVFGEKGAPETSTRTIVNYTDDLLAMKSDVMDAFKSASALANEDVVYIGGSLRPVSESVGFEQYYWSEVVNEQWQTFKTERGEQQPGGV